MPVVTITHFSDVLCIWAYGGQANLYRLMEEFGDKIAIDVHYCSVFPDTQTKISATWRDRGGFEGYGAHVREVAGRFDGLALHGDVWSQVRPSSSASPHLFLKAVELIEGTAPEGASPGFAGRLSVRAALEIRRVFFEQAQDIANWGVQRSVYETIGIGFDAVLAKIETGEAMARLAGDYEMGLSLNIQGSPTYLMNQGRQKLFGNVSYGVLAANIRELIAGDQDENASSCS